MSFQLEATDADSLPEIEAFLRNVFRAPPDSPNLDPQLLRWKYYEPGPEWDGSRSYVLRKGQALAAHSGVWPIRLATPSGRVQAIQAVDWAGAREIPGAGVALMGKLRGLASVLITVGGSEDTRKVLPAMGFKQRGAARLYARVLRPWRQFRTRPSEGSRAFPRLLRNAAWSRSAIASVDGWTCRLTPNSDADLLSRFSDRTRDYAESRHSAGFLEFMLRCPSAAVRYFKLSRDSAPEGYFVLSRVGGQDRLADLRILSNRPGDWVQAYAVAVRAAAEDPQSCELVTSATVPLVVQAVEANGFRFRGENPVFVLDSKQILGDPAHLHLGMLDDDSAYLNFPANPYST